MKLSALNLKPPTPDHELQKGLPYHLHVKRANLRPRHGPRVVPFGERHRPLVTDPVERIWHVSHSQEPILAVTLKSKTSKKGFQVAASSFGSTPLSRPSPRSPWVRWKSAPVERSYTLYANLVDSSRRKMTFEGPSEQNYGVDNAVFC